MDNVWCNDDDDGMQWSVVDGIVEGIVGAVTWRWRILEFQREKGSNGLELKL